MRKRIPQIRGGRIRIFMRVNVAADSIPEDVLAKKALQYPQKRLALFVSYIVEGAIGFGLRSDRLLNRMRGRTRIAFHGRFLGDSGAPRRISRQFPRQPDFPLRVELRGAFAAHPRGESFVEPEVVPPSHRDEVAKPHMGHLMRQHFVDILLRIGGGILRIE